MSRAILAGLVALLGLSTGAAFATNDFLAEQAASQAAFLSSGHLAAEGGGGSSPPQGSTSASPKSSPSSSPSKQATGGNSQNMTKNPGGPAKQQTGGNSQNMTNNPGGPAKQATGGNSQNMTKNPGGPAKQATGGDSQNMTNNTNTNTPAGGCSGGGGCDQGAQQATKDKEAAAQKAAERTRDYVRTLQEFNRDRTASPAEIKAAKEAAVSRLSQTPAAPTPRAPGMAAHKIGPTQGTNRYTTSMSNRVSMFQTPAQYDLNTSAAQRQAVVEGIQDFANRDQQRLEAGLDEGRKAQAERDAQALTDSWNDYSNLRGYMEREMAQVRAEQEAEQREISDDDLRETAVSAGFPTSVGDAEAVAERLAGYVTPAKEITDRVPTVDPTVMQRNYQAYNNVNAVNPDGTPASPSTLKGSPETVSSISDPDAPTRESIKNGIKNDLAKLGAFGALDPKTGKYDVPETGPGSIQEMVDQEYRDTVADYSVPEVNRTPPATFSGRGKTDPTADAKEYSASIAKAEATRKAFNDPTRASLTPSEQRMRDMASYGEGQDTTRMNAELDRRDREAAARENAEASAQGLGGFGNYQSNAGTNPQQQADARARADAQARAEASAQGLGGFGIYQGTVGNTAQQQADAQAEARARAEASAQGLGGYNNYQQNAGTAPSQQADAIRDAFNDPTRGSLTPSEQRIRDTRSYGEAQDTMRMNAELDRRDREATARENAEASAQGLGGFGNYQTNLGTAPNQSVKTTDSGLVETAPGKGDLETEQSLAQKIGGWVKDVFTSTEPMPKSDQVVQKTTVPVKGTVTVNGVKVEVKAERNIETGELSTPIGGVAGDNTSVSAPDGIQTVKTEKGTVVDVKVQGGRVVGISGKERADVAQGLGGFGNYQNNLGTEPSERVAAQQAEATRKAFNDPTRSSLTPSEQRLRDMASYGEAQDTMRMNAELDRRDRVATAQEQEASHRQAESDARIAEERAAKIADIDRKVAIADASLYNDFVAPVVGAVTRPFKAFSSWWNKKPATPATEDVAEVPQHGTPEERLQQEINAALSDTEITTPEAIDDRVPTGKQIDDRILGGEATNNVSPQGTFTMPDGTKAQGVVATKNDLNNPPAQAAPTVSTAQTPRIGQSIFESQNPADKAYTGRAPAVENRVLALKDGTIAARMSFDAVNGRFSLNTGEQPKTDIPDGLRSYAVDGVRVNVQFRGGKAVSLGQSALPGPVNVTPAADVEDERQALNDALYGPGTVPEAVVPGAKVQPKPATPEVKTVEPDENEVVANVENVPEDEKPAPKPAEKKKGVIGTIRSWLPGGNPPSNPPRNDGGGSGSDGPWWVKEQTRKEPVATTTEEVYDRSWMEALRARLGW